MKNLWFTLLASLVLCGSSFVFNGSGERSVLELADTIALGILESDKVINTIDYQIFKFTDAYPSIKKYDKKWQDANEFITTNFNTLSLPKEQKNVKPFVEKWNELDSLYFATFLKDIVNENERKYYRISLNGVYFHRNQTHRLLLSEILKSKLKIVQIAHGNEFAKRAGGSEHWICDPYIAMPSKLRLKINESAEIPMVFNNRCYEEKYGIDSLWINNQLVFNPKRYTSSLGKNKFDLVYTGENTHRVKIAFQHLVNAPIIVEERIYDFEINECD
jgi:hypothetical protein